MVACARVSRAAVAGTGPGNFTGGCASFGFTFNGCGPKGKGTDHGNQMVMAIPASDIVH